MNKLKKYCAQGIALCALVFASVSASAYDFVSYNATTGDVTFTPQGLVTPLITGIIALLATVAAIWVIIWFVSYIKRLMGR